MRWAKIISAIAYRVWLYGPLLLIGAVFSTSNVYAMEYFTNYWDALDLLMGGKVTSSTVKFFYYLMPVAQAIAFSFGLVFAFPNLRNVKLVDWGLFVASQLYMFAPYLTFITLNRDSVIYMMGTAKIFILVLIFISKSLGTRVGSKICLLIGMVCVSAFHCTIFKGDTPSKLGSALVSLIIGSLFLEISYSACRRSAKRYMEKETMVKVDGVVLTA